MPLDIPSDKTDDSIVMETGESDKLTLAWRDVLPKRKRENTTNNDETNSTNTSKRASYNLQSKNKMAASDNNRFSPLLQIQEQEDTQQTPLTRSTTPPPPIYLQSDVDYLKLRHYLTQLVGPEAYRCSSTIRGVTIHPLNSDAYRTITKSLKDSQAPFHTYQLSEDKAFRVVIRGLHHTIGEDNLATELKNLDFQVRKVTNILSRDKIKLPLFFVDLEPNPKNSQIFKIDSLFSSKIKVEEPRQKRQIVQCTRCQRYGHTKGYCNLPPRCVRCAGAHESTTCTKSKDLPATCVLCNSSHPANYRGCTVHRELQNRRSTTQRQPNLAQPVPDISSFPSLPPNQLPAKNTPSTTINSHRIPTVSYSQATLSTKQDDSPHSNSHSNIDISNQLSMFVTEMKQLISPMISLMSQLIQALLNKNGN